MDAVLKEVKLGIRRMQVKFLGEGTQRRRKIDAQSEGLIARKEKGDGEVN